MSVATKIVLAILFFFFRAHPLRGILPKRPMLRHPKSKRRKQYTEKIMNMTHHVTKMNAKKDGNTNGKPEVLGDRKEYIKKF